MFGDAVRAHRRRLGLTQEELAGRSGVSVRTIRAVEAGRVASPRPGTVRLLADAFGLRGGARDDFQALALAEPAEETADRLVPAQLPSDVAGFTGRQEQVRWLTTSFDRDGAQPTAVVISAVSGTAGVGKTALAVHGAHQMTDRFPDGQLYLNLRGYDPDQPMSPGDALARFLAALGVPGPDIPFEVDDRAARYRTQLAGRRMLILLDNAATVEQVRPLLPGTGSCAVIVTSRDSLAGLVAVHGAHRLDLDVLPPADAIALLRRLIGPRVDAEARAAAALAERCAHLPLALRVAAELAVSHPTTPLADLVAELSDQGQRLHLLDAGGDPRATVTTVFSWSVRHLPADAARTFALLGLHPGPDFDAYTAAALTDTGHAQARRILQVLARAHLIHPTGPGRFGMHDLLRAYATGLAADEGPRAALDRLFDYYLATAAAAMDTRYPAEAHYRPRIPAPATPVPAMPDPDTARTWLDTERPSLLAVAAHTAAHGWPTHTIRLSVTLFRYLDGGHHADALVIHTHAHHAAQQTGDPADEAHALLGLASAHVELGRYASASEHHHHALALFRRSGNREGEARVLNSLGSLERLRGRYGQAAEHHEQALDLFRQIGDRTGQARTLNNLGIIERRRGHYRSAADHLEQAVALSRSFGNPDSEAHALNGLGMIELHLGRYEAAAKHLHQALTHFREIGNRDGEAHALDNLGVLHTRLGEAEDAAGHFQQALAIFRRIGNRAGEAWVRNGLGEAAHAAGNLTDALTHHATALATAAQIGAHDQQARAQAGLGRTHRALGDPDRARAHYEQALAIYTHLGMPEADDIRTEIRASPTR